MTRNITVIVSPEGKTKIETSGYSGSSCQEASKFLEELLGNIDAEQLKPEYFEYNTNHNNQEIHQ